MAVLEQPGTSLQMCSFVTMLVDVFCLIDTGITYDSVSHRHVRSRGG